MSEPPADADLEDLRRAIAPLRFPLLLAAMSWGLLVLLNASAALMAMTTTGGVWQASSDGIVIAMVLNLGVHGLLFVPVVLLARAAIAGFQSRVDPSRLVELARLHHRAWQWIGGIAATTLGLTILSFLLLVR